MARAKRGLERLLVIDRLTVGPVEVKPDRLTAPYVVRQGRETHATELSYKYEEPVFDPADPVDQNLACLIAAQVALNYGLFCREIRFRGSFDAHDRRLLEEMARNTAREILVKKFLEPNPFLTDAARKLEVPRQRDFLQSRLRFDALPTGDKSPRADSWRRRNDQVAVLSSGGKDSLLSYGLLNEIGQEVHSIFVNESGRHWYTALNAYRHFQQHVPHTARVWTDADRLFAWMLRRFPFIREDFASLRSDEYPIRLWTVAVFLFGALPLLRRRGIGRLVVGDEYDTTLRLKHQGIPHYGGLFDQSRYFDEALTRYFGRKGWAVSQFSILRPLSELLIEKILANRYPALLRLQTSCHATHIDGEQVRPCGRCEKCRRIVGMLLAVGADPTACGYNPHQIAEALRTLATLGVHQEAEGAAHMIHLLSEQALLRPDATQTAAVEPRPEVLKLRFHRQRSPYDTIPNALRRPLYRILGEHADGAVYRSGRVWTEVDPLGDDSLISPYRFERARDVSPFGARAASEGYAPPYLLAALTWPEAERRFQEVDIALLPVGALEQHGPHLPLDVDTFDAARLCQDVAASCGAPQPLVLPAIPYGVSYHHEGFAGTVSISPRTLTNLVYEIGLSLSRHGITKLIIVNGHGGNEPALNFAAQLINRDARIFTCVDTGETSDVDVGALAETPNDVHAGEIETSTTLALRPEVVRPGLARPQVPRFSSEFLNFNSNKSVEWYARTARLSDDGTLGDPTRASAEKGREMWDVMVRNLRAFVQDLQSMSLDEIYDRRY